MPPNVLAPADRLIKPWSIADFELRNPELTTRKPSVWPQPLDLHATYNPQSAIRNFKIAILLCALLLVTCSSVLAQEQKKIPRVGIIFIGGRDQPHLEAFKQGLREHGYTEGKNIVLNYRYAEGKVDRL